MISVRLPIQTWYRRPPEVADFSALSRNGFRCTVASVGEVPEAWLRLQIFLQPEDALVREHPPDLRIGVQQVAEDPRSGGACLGAGRQPTLPGTLDAEGALLHHARLASAVAQIVLVRVHLFGRNLRRAPVEAARPVGAGGHTVAAPDAPVVVDDRDAVRFLPGGADGADLHTRRISALEALGAQVEVALRGHLVLEGRVGVVEIDDAVLHLEDADVLGGGAPVEVVLVDAGLDAAAEPLALRNVEGIAEHHAGLGAGGLDGDVHPAPQLGQALEPGDGLRPLLFRHELVVALDVLSPREKPDLSVFVGCGAERCTRTQRLRASRHSASEDFQREPPVDGLLQYGAVLGVPRYLCCALMSHLSCPLDRKSVV